MLLQDPNYSASCLLRCIRLYTNTYCGATFLITQYNQTIQFLDKKVWYIKCPLNIISIRIGDLKWIFLQS